MISGEILFYKNFPYEDGGDPTNKLLIVLNSPDNDAPFLVLRTTSQRKFRLDKQGCHSDKGYYVFKKKDDFFNADNTWVLFNTITELNTVQFINWSLKMGVETKGNLKENNLIALKNCLKRWPDLSKFHKSLL